MKYIFWISVFLSIASSPGFAAEAGLSTRMQYAKGSPVILRLNYHGGIKDWDANASIEKDMLILANAMFISISDSKGETVKPKQDKVLSVWADTYFRNPFSLVLDISKFYNLLQPGEYILQWGCEGVKKDIVLFEIID